MKKILVPVAIGIALALSAAPAGFAKTVKSKADLKKLEKKPVEKGPEGRQRAGVLACTIDGGIGLLVGSSKGVNCTFKNRATGKTETYTGKMNKIGLDIGITGEQYMRWVVFGPQGGENIEGFAGKYRGVSAGAGLVVAFGANALIGGSDKNFVLQPVSAQAGTGLNVAVGIASMTIARTN